VDVIRAPVQRCAVPVDSVWMNHRRAQAPLGHAGNATRGVRAWGRRGDDEMGVDLGRRGVVHDPQPLLLSLEKISL
jgi:hypothetical protein